MCRSHNTWASDVVSEVCHKGLFLPGATDEQSPPSAFHSLAVQPGPHSPTGAHLQFPGTRVRGGRRRARSARHGTRLPRVGEPHARTPCTSTGLGRRGSNRSCCAGPWQARKSVFVGGDREEKCLGLRGSLPLSSARHRQETRRPIIKRDTVTHRVMLVILTLHGGGGGGGFGASQFGGGEFGCGRFGASPWILCGKLGSVRTGGPVEILHHRPPESTGLGVGLPARNLAEAPGFGVGNLAAKLKRQISHGAPNPPVYNR